MKKVLSLMLFFGFVVGMAAITGCSEEKKTTTPPVKDGAVKEKAPDKK